MVANVFKESQKFNQPLLWVIILTTYIPLHIFSIRDLFIEYSKGGNWWSSEIFIAALIGLVLLNLLLVLFLFLTLETQIDNAGIQFRYPPVLNSWRKIPWKEVQAIDVSTYSPWEYGGWGIRLSWRGWAYNVRGNKGIMIKKKNGKRILIGTQKAIEAKQAIENQMREERD